MSIFANSWINFELFQITFPLVSAITSGNGEFIRVLFAAVSTVSVRSLMCSESSAFLLLFARLSTSIQKVPDMGKIPFGNQNYRNRIIL